MEIRSDDDCHGFRHNTVTAGSASQDGMLCVWDLLTGACMYSLQVSTVNCEILLVL